MTIKRYRASPESSESGGSQSPEDAHQERSPISLSSSSGTSQTGSPPLEQDARRSFRKATTASKIPASTERRVPQPSLTAMIASPAVSVNQHSISYLFTAYLGAANHYLDSGFSGVLETIVQKGRPARYLSAAISATSIAAFSRRPNARSLTARAEKVYSRALVEVNKALVKPESIHDDDLLASILILAMYELFMSDRLTGYYNHILGAAMIIRSRQSGPLSSATAAMAFLLVRNEIMKSSMLSALSSIQNDLDPWKHWVHELGLDKWTADAYSHLPASVMSGPIMHFKALLYQALEDSSINTTRLADDIVSEPAQSEVKPSRTSDDVPVTVPGDPLTVSSPSGPSPDHLIRRLADMYGRFANVNHIMGELYNVGPVSSLPVPSGIPRAMDGWVLFPQGPIFMYHTMLHAGYRLAMALACLEPCSRAVGIVMSSPELSFLRDTHEYQQLEEGGKQAIAEIVGSAPYFCGLLNAPAKSGSSASSSHQFDVAGIRDAQAVSFSTWALAAVIMSPQATATQREYSLGMLRYCHQVKGLGQAAALHEACMEVLQRYAMAGQSTTSGIPASWMGRGTSLESLIYADAKRKA